ncbi:hypothetical protein SDC9_65347 [bioreactor metagenome]|uniref:Uncharacterized protein n=1 Tax=bioreactor metagenome TaxID=1076179 RepID=A0A644XS80_9ZZZZ
MVGIAQKGYIAVRPAFHLNGEEKRTLPTQVEELDQALVEEQPAHGAGLRIALDHKGNGLIQRIGIGSIVAEGVAVVHGEPSSSSVWQSALVAEAVELIRL